MIQAIAGHIDANSYVDLTYADTFFLNSIGNDAWPAIDSEKEAALIESTRILDLLFDWVGLIATDTQALRWPRSDVLDMDGRPVDPAAVPKILKDATCNLAYYLIQNGGLNQAQSNLKGLKVGPIDLKFSEGKSVVGVPKFIIKSLQSIGLYEGFVEGSIYNVNAVRA